ncbi:heterokaryon incompatibility protein [Phlyctema vagabunda]|uniref:Heterokaryon incompatibility protein n=1 Tax=Phlyctema vagabunda TaxID=108571 RepID=A0ABR4PBG0_9HELO
MLCHLCSEIDLDQLVSKTGLKHHVNFSALCKSAEAGCEMCKLIRTCQEGESSTKIKVKTGSEKWDATSQIVLQCRRRENGQLNPVIWLSQTSNTKAKPYVWGGCTISAAADDALAPVLQNRPIDTDPASARCFDLATSWLQKCLGCHTDCSNIQRGMPYLPTRVVDIGLDADAVPRLHVSHGERSHWVTLSHCWGAVHPLKTTISSLEAHKVSLPLNKLPELFKDAIRITRHFKQRYLWIDSLCIIQDSAEDWQIESANMGYIYKNSTLTIACDATSNSTESILDPNLTDRHLYSPTISVPYRSATHDIKGVLHLRRNIRVADMVPGPLSRRAWTLQEDVLSPRVLRWTKQQLRWQCRSSDWTEELPSGTPKNNRSLNPGRFICLPPELLVRRRSEIIDQVPAGATMDVPTLWYRMVNDFASRSLTYDTDRFAAISGLAREVEKHTLNDYRAGLWNQEIHRGLLWYVSPTSTEPSEYIAPSWSWASINTRPNPNRTVWSLFHPHLKPFKGSGHVSAICRVLDIKVTNITTDVFSQVTSGSLTIQGPVFRADLEDHGRFVQARTPRVSGDKIFEHQDVRAGTLLYRLDLASELMPGLLGGVLVVQIAKMAGYAPPHSLQGMIYGLLCQVAREVDGAYAYKRIGIVRISEVFADEKCWREEAVKII